MSLSDQLSLTAPHFLQQRRSSGLEGKAASVSPTLENPNMVRWLAVSEKLQDKKIAGLKERDGK